MPITDKERTEILDNSEVISNAVIKNVKKTKNGFDVDIERVVMVGKGKDSKA